MSRRNHCFNWDMRLYGTAQGWWDPSDSDTVTIATGVSQLDDKSGNARNAANADTATQPPSTTINGKGAIDIQADDNLAFASIDISGGFYSFAVTELGSVTASTPTRSLLYGVSGSNSDWYFWIGGNVTGGLTNERMSFLCVQSSLVSGYGQTSENIAAGGHLLSFWWTTGDTKEYRIDNVAKTLTTHSNGSFAARSPVSINQIGNPVANPFGKVGETIIYSALNSNYSTSFINNLINHKWGVY